MDSSFQKEIDELYNPNVGLDGKFWVYNTPGERLAGTYVALRDGSDMQGNPQPIYVIKDVEGNINLVGGKPAIAKQMQDVQLGQVLIFEYLGIGKASKVGWKPPKRVFVHKISPSTGQPIFDKNWKSEQGAVEELAAEFGGQVMPDFGTPNDVPFVSTPRPATVQTASLGSRPAPEAPVAANPMYMVICEFAKAKFGAVTPDQVKTKIEESTKLAMVEANYPSIIAALSKV